MADVFDDETEQTVTIDEYLDNVEAEELEADLVLGGDEGKECTYGMGYMKRQAVFSCLTCVPDGNAGVCTACSLSCHDGHEIVELWTKRNFRCDCGNSKFGASYCKLFPKKDIENAENSYNHNFKGLYCTCERPYPDPNVEDQEEMIQCIMCEDWFHEEHLGLESPNEIPRDEEGEPLYEDFICKACSDSCSFLALYPQSIWATGRQSGSAPVTTSKDKDVMQDIPSSSGSGMIDNGMKDNAMTSANSESVSVEKTSVTGESSFGLEHCEKDTGSHSICSLGADVVVTMAVLECKPLFLSKNWRDTLCRCERCLDMYNQRHVSYLLDKEDSIAEYEKVAKQKREEKLQQQEGAELSFLDKLGHVEKMEILNGIADFKDEFRSFLESFDKSKAVTPSHVQQIFENLVKKRRRLQ
ncbi:hypothetical protein Tsubulata_013763 [Turnera subulata]|uniref:UBR-type domain-containing protein n=1 Tax=Turnera subulata TaxID=218843 RepID=A0A9Q0FDU5_9ROSI|nr:hypothetical protein Tsubulata_013763 [Turnera subulata]